MLRVCNWNPDKLFYNNPPLDRIQIDGTLIQGVDWNRIDVLKIL